MAFPSTPLDIRVQVALDMPDLSDPFSWSWTDASSSVLVDSGINISIGRRDGLSQMPASTMSLTVDNSDGRWTRTNPSGAWYGRLSRNTPIRVQVNNGSGYKSRFTGTIDAFPPRWDYTGRYAVAQLTASGAMRRAMQRGSTRSSLFRAHTSGYYSTSAAVGYWPCEDASGATLLASGLTGHPPAVFGGDDFSPAADSSIAGSDPLPTIGANGYLRCAVPPYPAATTWAIRAVMKIPTGASGVLLYWGTPTGSGNIQWALSLDSGTDLVHIAAINSSGTDVVADTGATVTALRDQQLYIEANGTQNGANIDWDYTFWLPNGSGSGKLGTLNSATVGNVTQVHLYNFAPTALADTTIGHIAVATDPFFGAGTYGATGYVGETAASRWVRFGTQLSLPYAWSIEARTRMGAQPTDTTIGQIREISATEGAPIYDNVNGYLDLPARSERYNATVALSLSFTGSQIQPPQPTDDDTYTRNDVTVTRRGGSSHRTTKTTGTNSTAVGVYEDSQSVNVEQDSDLPFRSQWLVHQGTVDELRYPQVDINLASRGMTTAKISNWLLCVPGSRVQLTGPNLPGLAPDTVDLLLEGWTEVLRSPRGWTASLNCTPYAPWIAFQLEDATLGRVETAGSTLVSAVSAGATSLTVATSDGPVWSTTAVPYDLHIAGERVTATAVANLATDTFTRTVSSGWGTATSGQAWVISGGTAADFATTGAIATMTHSAVGATHSIQMTLGVATIDVRIDASHNIGTVTAGDLASFIDFRMVDASNLYRLTIRWKPAGTATAELSKVVAGVGSTIATETTIPGATSTSALTVRMSAVGTQVQAKAWVTGQTEPGWLISAADSSITAAGDFRVASFRDTGNTNNPTVFRYDNLAVTNPQTVTVTRAVNSVSKAQSAAADVTLWRPGAGGLAL